MGQYWYPVNLDKKEFIHPHELGSGIKLWEQLANHPSTGAALIILCAAMPQARGGGDFDLEENWHGPERTFPERNTTPAPMPKDYQETAAAMIGRWAGDRIALVGDYAEDTDLSPKKGDPPASTIYGLCSSDEWKDITADVARVIEHELHGSFVDGSWKEKAA
jgi:hypothetical protein